MGVVVGDHAQVHRQWAMDALLRLVDPSRLAVGTSVEAKEDPSAEPRPLLLVDIDGVLSLFGFPPHATARGRPCTSSTAYPTSFRPPPPATCSRLSLSSSSSGAAGWEEKADEHLPHLLGLPRGCPT